MSRTQRFFLFTGIDTFLLLTFFYRFVDVSATGFWSALIGAAVWNLVALSLDWASSEIGIEGSGLFGVVRVFAISAVGLMVAGWFTGGAVHVGGFWSALGAALLDVLGTLGVLFVIGVVLGLLSDD